jgi:hypothetical protein
MVESCRQGHGQPLPCTRLRRFDLGSIRAKDSHFIADALKNVRRSLPTALICGDRHRSGWLFRRHPSAMVIADRPDVRITFARFVGQFRAADCDTRDSDPSEPLFFLWDSAQD